MKFQRIYCDNHLLVVDKPKGMCTQPDSTHSLNLLDLAKEWVKKQFQKPGSVFLEPIHRLDRPVGGLVLFARTSKALSRLQKQMREREMVKTYTALVEGILPSARGKLEHFLVHDAYRANVVNTEFPGGKRAVLSYQFIDQWNKSGALLSQVEIQLETGRYHQIRAQFGAVKCPIFGDQKYGSAFSLAEEMGIALVHSQLQFLHPVTGISLHFTSSMNVF